MPDTTKTNKPKRARKDNDDEQQVPIQAPEPGPAVGEIKSYNQATQFGLGANTDEWIKKTVDNAAIAYPTILDRVKSHVRVVYKTFLKDNDAFNVVMKRNFKDDEQISYVAFLVSSNRNSTVLVKKCESMIGFEDAVKLLFTAVSEDMQKQLNSILAGQEGKFVTELS